ncbi:hypothetical protein FB451DRAFT_1407543 [Mycena latifolia]|nr:hypothetical protein FB451DRAFT_1407543 [Mycena latifolia]
MNWRNLAVEYVICTTVPRIFLSGRDGERSHIRVRSGIQDELLQQRGITYRERFKGDGPGRWVQQLRAALVACDSRPSPQKLARRPRVLGFDCGVRVEEETVPQVGYKIGALMAVMAPPENLACESGCQSTSSPPTYPSSPPPAQSQRVRSSPFPFLLSLDWSRRLADSSDPARRAPHRRRARPAITNHHLPRRRSSPPPHLTRLDGQRQRRRRGAEALAGDRHQGGGRVPLAALGRGEALALMAPPVLALPTALVLPFFPEAVRPSTNLWTLFFFSALC